MFLKFSLRSNFIESDLARTHAIAGVCDPAALQNFLKLAIFTKSSVDRIEREIDIVRQLEIIAPYVYFHYFSP